MKHAWSRLFKLFLHFWFPRTCFACGRDLKWDATAPLCPACEAALAVPGPLICRRCGAVLKSGGAHCYACRGSKARPYKCAVIRSAFVFNTSSRALVHALKYARADYLASYMGMHMARRFASHPELAEAEVLVPVPLFPKRGKQRGYNQSELLARSLGRQIGLPVNTTALARVRNTVSQTTLGRKGRLQNMSGAFKTMRPQEVKGKVVLLIDDVATTGATLEGCAQALRAADAKKVLAYTFARE